MSVNCNKIEDLPFDKMEQKTALGRSVSIAVLGALSDCYKAIENLQTEHAAKHEVVYLQSAAIKLETAEKALHKTRDILASGRPSDEVVAWLNNRDFDLLYRDGVQRGFIPSSIDQWNRLVRISRTHDHLGFIDVLIADVSSIRVQIESLIETRTSVNIGASLKRDEVQSLVRLQSALAELAVFGQMVAYVNAIEPLTDEWSEEVAIATIA